MAGIALRNLGMAPIHPKNPRNGTTGPAFAPKRVI